MTTINENDTGGIGADALANRVCAAGGVVLDNSFLQEALGQSPMCAFQPLLGDSPNQASVAYTALLDAMDITITQSSPDNAGADMDYKGPQPG